MFIIINIFTSYIYVDTIWDNFTDDIKQKHNIISYVDIELLVMSNLNLKVSRQEYYDKNSTYQIMPET